jgi:hypothetical protein
MIMIEKDIKNMNIEFNKRYKKLKDVLEKTISLEGLNYKLEEKMMKYLERKINECKES